MTYDSRFSEILPFVRKPARYIGREWNAVVKRDPGAVRVALAFPDTYEVGMSHLGVKILYNILNQEKSIACERVFAPWTDMEEKMREAGLPLATLETQTPLSEVDIVGFSLQYELSYTNVLAMLDLGGIPIRSEKRGREHPLVIAGGPCAFNPEPLAPFIDLFLLGDAEESFPSLVREYGRYRKERLGREELLRLLNRRREVYVPSLAKDERDPVSGLRYVPRVHVMKKTLLDLNQAPYPTRLVVPYMETVHDRVTLEVSRGCQVGCRFCQAGIIYRPSRDRRASELFSLTGRSLAETGHNEASLLSLNAGGYPHLHEVASGLIHAYAGRRVSVSLSSLRAPALTAPLAEAVAEVRKSGFTIAAECGTERLRRVINKNITREDVLAAARNAFGHGWRLIKLYFMIGLPTETDEDVDAIADLAREVQGIARKASARGRLNVGVSSFVPKPHTPFQWLPMAKHQELEEKLERLRRRLRRTPIRVRGHDVAQSLLEGVFSRGDRDLARALEEAFLRGHRFDGWTERFDARAWDEVFERTGIDPAKYRHRPLDPKGPLPWGHIYTGVSKTFLAAELDKALASEPTPECGPDLCFSCGPCSKEFLAERQDEAARLTEPPAIVSSRPSIEESFLYRVRYRKGRGLRFLSHLDVHRTFLRGVHRAGLPVVYSQGFHPLARIGMGPPLPVGASGDRELLDLVLAGYLEPKEVLERLVSAMPKEMAPSRVVDISRGTPALCRTSLISVYEAEVAPLGLSPLQLASMVKTFLASPRVEVERRHGSKVARKDVRADVKRLEVSGTRLSFDLLIPLSGGKSPFAVVSGITGASQDEVVGAALRRRVLLHADGLDLMQKRQRLRLPYAMPLAGG